LILPQNQADHFQKPPNLEVFARPLVKNGGAVEDYDCFPVTVIVVIYPGNLNAIAGRLRYCPGPTVERYLDRAIS